MADTNDYGSETSHQEMTQMTTTEPSEPVLLASRRSYQDFLKTCADGAEINDRGVLVVSSTPSDQASDEIIMVVDNNNTNRNDDRMMNSSGNDENIESTSSASCEKLSKIINDDAATAFKDPFPLLSPMPLKSLQSSRNRLNVQNVARHNAMNMMQDNNNSNNNNTRSSSSSSTTTTPIMKSNYQNEHLAPSNERDSDDSSIATPPHFPPYNYNNASSATTPIRTTTPLQRTSPTAATASTPCNDDQKLWIDPFPTPDVSVHSRCGTPLSAPRQHNNNMSDSMTMEDNNSTSFTIGKNLNADWETIMLNIPNVPIVEESRSNYNNSPVVEVKVNNDTRRKDGVGGVGAAAKSTSLPRIVCVDYSTAENFPVRKVESMPSMMSKRPSLEDFWGALQVGPDGNDLVTTDDYGYLHKNKGRKKRERRASANNLSIIWRDKPFEYQGNELGRPRRRRGKEDVHQRSLGAPGKSEAFERRFAASTQTESSWKDLRSPMIPFPDDDGQNNESIDTTDFKKNNSATLTNVTGASLAKEVKELIVQRKSIASANKNPMTRGQSLTLTPNRLRFRVLNNIKTSRAVANAGELVFSPVRSVRNTGKRAAKLVRTTRQKLKERKELRRQRKLARMKAPPRSWWIVIPADHPYKVAWDVVTILWALLGAHRTHVRIRDRVFDQSPLILLTEVWFTIDILLNFVTEHKTRQGQVIRDGKVVWARYLTTWFIIDILSLIPWERVYVRPVVERIKKRNFFQKTFFRSKAVVRVSRVLRGRHIKLFGRVSKQTGTPLRRMVALVIKYLPKYLVFLRNMKGALVVRALRFVHWLHNMYKKIWVKARNAARHRIGHPIFGLLGYRDDQDDDDDSDCSDDDHDDEDEIDTDDESIDEDEDEDDVLVLMTDSDFDETPLSNFHRTASEGSPRVGSMRRSLSQNELSQRFRRGL